MFPVWIPDGDENAGDGDERTEVAARRVDKQTSKRLGVAAGRDSISPAKTAGSIGYPGGAGSWLAGI
jgi:hypothetical protein